MRGCGACGQDLAREQGGRSKEKMRSLKEIQEEEQARRVEAEFLAWWAAEEERLRVEQEGGAPSAQGGPSSRRSKGKRKEGGKDGAKDGAKKPGEGQGQKEKKAGSRREGGSKDVSGPADGGAPSTPKTQKRRRPGPGSNNKSEGPQAKNNVPQQH